MADRAARSARRGAAQPENPLERAIRRFQHRWETEPRYRAQMSGVLGLLVLVSLCGGVFAVGNVATAGLSALGLGGGRLGPIGTPTTGSKLVNGTLTFPTPTVVLAPGSAPAPSPIPNSQTPIPSPTPTPTPTPSPTPTDVPTPTPCQANCGGPTPSPGPGATVNVTGWAPAAWRNNQSASVTAHTSVPNDPINFIVFFNSSGVTVLSASNYPNLQTDGAGNVTFGFQVPAGACSLGSTAKVSVQAQFGGYGPDAFVPCR